MAEKWKEQMEPLLESLNHLDDIRIRIKDAERAILILTKKTEETNENEEQNDEMAHVRLLEEVQTLIENVELKTNQLDMKLSAIERLLRE
ncbi:MAG: hypothetical protein ACW98Y_12320 [Candidatus Thorarchaeota archaeon]